GLQCSVALPLLPRPPCRGLARDGLCAEKRLRRSRHAGGGLRRATPALPTELTARRRCSVALALFPRPPCRGLARDGLRRPALAAKSSGRRRASPRHPCSPTEPTARVRG